jgi:Na+-transporting methylmalonyl-CoA/oxaloacetate decarboxylase gamma subunit
MSDYFLLGQVSQQTSEVLMQPLLQQGLDLMTFGMGAVFIFLAVLVAVTALVSVVIHHFFPDDFISEAAVIASPITSAQVVNSLAGSPEDNGAVVKSGGKYHGKLERHQLLKILQKAIDQYRSDP